MKPHKTGNGPNLFFNQSSLIRHLKEALQNSVLKGYRILQPTETAKAGDYYKLKAAPNSAWILLKSGRIVVKRSDKLIFITQIR